MKTIIKTIKGLLIGLLIIPLLSIFINVHSTTYIDDNVLIEGVSVRGTDVYTSTSSSTNGIRFVAGFDGFISPSGYEISKYGIIICHGEVLDLGEFLIGATIDSHSVLMYEASELIDTISGDKLFATIINIPASHRNDIISARAFVKVVNSLDLSDERIYYGTNYKSTSLVDATRKVYNILPDDSPLLLSPDGVLENFTHMLALKNKIKVTKANGTTLYINDIGSGSSYTIEAGDELDLIRGEYSRNFRISVNNVKIYGANKDVSITSINDGVRNSCAGETVLTGTIETRNGVSGFELNGVKIDSPYGLILYDSQTNLKYKYNYVSFSSQVAIYDDTKSLLESEVVHSNIEISHNYFDQVTNSLSSDIALLYKINGILIDSNTFSNSSLEFNETDYAVLIGAPASSSLVTITGNRMMHHGANYIVSIGYSLTEKVSYSVDIENNDFSCNDNLNATTYLNGNGLGIFKLGTSSSVIVKNNSNINTSKYYNAVIISTSTTAAKDYSISTVDFRGNTFICNTTLSKPAGRSTSVLSDVIRLGVGASSVDNFTSSGNTFSLDQTSALYSESTGDTLISSLDLAC